MDTRPDINETVGINATSNSTTHGLNQAFIARNIGLGSVGMIENMAAFVVLLFSPDIRRPLKISLLSLVTNDIAFMSTLVVYGGLNWTGTSGEPACFPILYIIVNSMTMNHYTTFQHALYNYIAVFYPLKFRVWINVKSTAIFTLATWVFSFATILASVELPLPANFPCVPVVGIRGIRITGFGITTVVLSIVVIALNVRVLWEIRSRHFKVQNMEQTPSNEDSRRQCELTQSSSSCHVQELTTNHGAKWQTPTCSSRSTSSEHLTVTTRDANHTTKAFFQGNKSNNFDTERLAVPTADSAVPWPKVSVNSRADENSHANTSLETVGLPHGGQGLNSFPRPVLASGTRLDLPHMRMTAPQTQPLPRNFRLRKTTVTLVVLSLWCCGLTLPFSIYLIWLTQLPDREMAQYALAPAGVLGSSLIIVNSVSNPFLYAWRFIDWPKMIKKFRRR